LLSGARIIKIDSSGPDPSAVQEVVTILKAGGVVAYPTETFYGLGADADNAAAVEKIFRIKGRDFKKPVPVIIGNVKDLPRLADGIPPVARRLIEHFWPGGLTIIFSASNGVLPRLTAGTNKIGIRLTSNPVALLIARGLCGPITATSANLSGGRECSEAGEVMASLDGQIDAIVDGGKTPGETGSTIIDITVEPPAILREGVVPVHLIRGIL
jgi:L-threonylcarbamoyladenylate synthase